MAHFLFLCAVSQSALDNTSVPDSTAEKLKPFISIAANLFSCLALWLRSKLVLLLNKCLYSFRNSQYEPNVQNIKEFQAQHSLIADTVRSHNAQHIANNSQVMKALTCLLQIPQFKSHCKVTSSIRCFVYHRIILICQVTIPKIESQKLLIGILLCGKESISELNYHLTHTHLCLAKPRCHTD